MIAADSQGRLTFNQQANANGKHIHDRHVTVIPEA